MSDFKGHGTLRDRKHRCFCTDCQLKTFCYVFLAMWTFLVLGIPSIYVLGPVAQFQK